MSDVILNFRAQGLEEMASDTAKASQELTELSAAEKQVDSSAKSLRSTLKDMREELGRLALAGQQNTEQYKKLRDEAGRLKDTIADVSEELTTAGSDTSGLDKALRATNVLLGGFTAVQGAVALFGDESEDLQKTLLKVNAAMSILNGLQAVQGELAKKDSIFTTAATRAKVLYAAATNGATAAVRLLRLAILGIVGGAVIAGIILLVKNWGKLTDAIGLSNKAVRELEATQQAAEANTEQRNKALERRIELLKLAGATQKEINAATIQELEIQRAANIAEIARLQREAKQIEDKIGGFSASSAFNPILALAQTRRIKALETLRTEIERLQNASVDFETAIRTANQSTKETTKNQKELNAEVEKYEGIVGRVAVDTTRLDGVRGRTATEIDITRKAIAVITSIEDEATQNYIEGVMKRKQAQLDANNEVAKSERTLKDQRRDDAVFYLGVITEVSGQITSVIQQSQNAQREQLKSRLDQGLISEKQYQKELSALNQKQAEQNKKLSIFNILLNTAQAISKALSAAPPPFNIILAAISGALGAAQLAIAKRTPIPAFRGGVIDLKGPGTATSDSIVARLSKGESVMTAQETVNHRDALTAMRKNDFDKKYVPIANMAAFVNKAIPTYYPSVGAKAVSGAAGNSNEIMKLQDELKFIGQYIRQGNNIAATSQQHLRDIKTTKRVIYT